MNDYPKLEKDMVRELLCRLCLCNDIVKLKPLSAEVKRRLKKLFDISVRTDDNLPRAICHECLQQLVAMYEFTIKVEKTRKFLDFYQSKFQEKQKKPQKEKVYPLTVQEDKGLIVSLAPKEIIPEKPSSDQQQKNKTHNNKMKKPPASSIAHVEQVKKRRFGMKYMEFLSLDEFATIENLDKKLFDTKNKIIMNPAIQEKKKTLMTSECLEIPFDSIVLVDTSSTPAHQVHALEKQISVFYKMECGICHKNGFQYSSLMRHYKDRHGVPGYVSCCNEKFHYYYPKKIIKHMDYHLQTLKQKDIF